jgi:large subunit ribosomal protein L23
MDIHPFEVLLKPLVTEKNAIVQDAYNQYAFKVNTKANKNQVKHAIELAFDVTVTGVNVSVVKGKMKRFGPRITRRPSWKKAIVSLRVGDKIQIFEGT